MVCAKFPRWSPQSFPVNEDVGPTLPIPGIVHYYRRYQRRRDATWHDLPFLLSEWDAVQSGYLQSRPWFV
jgi:hypothetical protein